MIAAFSVCRRGPAFGSALVRMIASSVSLNHLVCEYGLKYEPAAGWQRRESLELTRTFALVADPFATGTAHDSGSA